MTNAINLLSSYVHKKTEIEPKQMVTTLHLPRQYVLAEEHVFLFSPASRVQRPGMAWMKAT